MGAMAGTIFTSASLAKEKMQRGNKTQCVTWLVWAHPKKMSIKIIETKHISLRSSKGGFGKAVWSRAQSLVIICLFGLHSHLYERNVFIFTDVFFLCALHASCKCSHVSLEKAKMHQEVIFFFFVTLQCTQKHRNESILRKKNNYCSYELIWLNIDIICFTVLKKVFYSSTRL